MASLLCVPTMLIFKPLILWWRMPKKESHPPVPARRYDNNDDQINSAEDLSKKLINKMEDE